jgi:hypothetical protein
MYIFVHIVDSETKIFVLDSFPSSCSFAAHLVSDYLHKEAVHRGLLPSEEMSYETNIIQVPVSKRLVPCA